MVNDTNEKWILKFDLQQIRNDLNQVEIGVQKVPFPNFERLLDVVERLVERLDS